MSTYLITGTSRGIGLELTKQLLELSPSKISTIIAVTRTRSDALDTLINQNPTRSLINLVIPDLTNDAAVHKAVEELETKYGISSIDVLINNAGAMPFTPEGAKSVTGDALREIFNTNVVSAQVVTAGFLPLLERGREKKVINVSSELGSIAAVERFAHSPSHGYKVSKAAMNMLTAQWALDYEGKGFTFLTISPGWIKTDLGSAYADLEVPIAIRSVLDIVFKANPEQNGKFLNVRVEGWEAGKGEGRNVYDGREIPW